MSLPSPDLLSSLGEWSASPWDGPVSTVPVLRLQAHITTLKFIDMGSGELVQP